MAAIGLQNGRPGLERGLPLGLRVLQTTFDMSNYSKRNIDEGEKKEKRMVKIVVHWLQYLRSCQWTPSPESGYFPNKL